MGPENGADSLDFGLYMQLDFIDIRGNQKLMTSSNPVYKCKKFFAATIVLQQDSKYMTSHDNPHKMPNEQITAPYDESQVTDNNVLKQLPPLIEMDPPFLLKKLSEKQRELIC